MEMPPTPQNSIHRAHHEEPGSAFHAGQFLLKAAWRSAYIGLLAVVAGCGSVPVYEQQHVSKPSMQFSDSATWQYQCNSFSQLETGLAFSGGAQPTTCSACK